MVNQELVEAMLQESPHLDRLIVECMVAAYEKGTLDSIMEKIQPPPKDTYTEVTGVSIEN